MDFRKRDLSQSSGWRYLYLGLWPHDVLNRMADALDDWQFVNALRSQANENAKRYLARKDERNGVTANKQSVEA